MKSRILALGITATVVFAACGGAATPSAAPTTAPTVAASAAATPPPAAKLSIMVGGMSKQIYLPNKLTEALGYFKDENLTVDLIDEPSGKDTTVEVVAGNVDLGSGSYDHTIDIAAQASRSRWSPCSCRRRARPSSSRRRRRTRSSPRRTGRA